MNEEEKERWRAFQTRYKQRKKNGYRLNILFLDRMEDWYSLKNELENMRAKILNEFKDLDSIR